MSPSSPYPYPVKNSDLIRHHKLEKHFEGGYFAQTVVLPSVPATSSTSVATVSNREQQPWGPGSVLCGGASEEQPVEDKDKQIDATIIYYLLTPDSYRGKMHMNLHSHFHIHHAGRALYTLIQPPSHSEEQPTVHRVVLGSNVLDGEVTQLFIPGGWWKASEIPEEDRLLLDAPDADDELKERIGCIISEVVVPGWQPEQHKFIDEGKLKDMWGGQPGWEPYAKYLSSAP